MTNSSHGGQPGAAPDWEAALVTFARGITTRRPDDLPDLVARCVALAGGHDPVILLVDMEQLLLRSFPAGEQFAVDGPDGGPGWAFRHESTVVEGPAAADGSTQLWLALMDSAERLGVLGVRVDGTVDVGRWEALASMVGEAIVSKANYGDTITLTRRSRPMSLAAELRWAILPPLTFTSDLIEISGLLEPAYDIAGDTFDYAISPDRAHLAILDAMGHGLEASQIANLAVGEYRRSRRAGDDLGTILRGIDEVVAREVGDHKFLTGQFAHVDLASGVVVVTNAGHPRPLLFRSGVAAGELDCRPCPPLGLGLVTTTTSEDVLASGDAILLYSDGVTEARDADGAEFGAERLAAAVERRLRAGERPAEVLRGVMHEVDRHTDGPAADDATVVLLRRP